MERSCGFCGIEESRVERLFLGPNVAICNVCVESCSEHAEQPYQSASTPENLAFLLFSQLGWGPLNCGTAIRARFCCEYCGTRLLGSLTDYYSWEVDHIVPGGEDSLENYALACHACNHLKHRYAPSGDSREERVADARPEIERRRASKMAELQKVRGILGLPPLVAS
jgi:5-methylcytosine-specific restriction endonuclease McrA